MQYFLVNLIVALVPASYPGSRWAGKGYLGPSLVLRLSVGGERLPWSQPRTQALGGRGKILQAWSQPRTQALGGLGKATLIPASYPGSRWAGKGYLGPSLVLRLSVGGERLPWSQPRTQALGGRGKATLVPASYPGSRWAGKGYLGPSLVPRLSVGGERLPWSQPRTQALGGRGKATLVPASYSGSRWAGLQAGLGTRLMCTASWPGNEANVYCELAWERG